MPWTICRQALELLEAAFARIRLRFRLLCASICPQKTGTRGKYPMRGVPDVIAALG